MNLIKIAYKYADKSAYIALLASIIVVSATYYLCHHPYQKTQTQTIFNPKN